MFEVVWGGEDVAMHHIVMNGDLGHHFVKTRSSEFVPLELTTHPHHLPTRACSWCRVHANYTRVNMRAHACFSIQTRPDQMPLKNSHTDKTFANTHEHTTSHADEVGRVHIKK